MVIKLLEKILIVYSPYYKFNATLIFKDGETNEEIDNITCKIYEDYLKDNNINFKPYKCFYTKFYLPNSTNENICCYILNYDMDIENF